MDFIIPTLTGLMVVATGIPFMIDQSFNNLTNIVF